MQQKQRIFIYDRREMAALLLLGVMVAVFAFTLGVHLGKKVGGKGMPEPIPKALPVATLPDKLPESKELAEQAKSLREAADESLNQALHDEVERTGLTLDTPRQVQLPKNPKSANAGATTLHPGVPVAVPAHSPAAAPSPVQASSPVHDQAGLGHFALQVGSYPARSDADGRVQEIRNRGLEPYVREADVKGSTWYRVYVGEFSTRSDAEKAGQSYQSKRLIRSFVVAKIAGRMSN
jgi:cell division protein FtsN